MIYIKTKDEIKILAEGGQILGRVLNQIAGEVKAGVDTEYLENLAVSLIDKAGGRPAFKNYKMGNGSFFPTALCLSINNEIVHAPALPKRILHEGDILSIDVGMEYPVRRESQIVNRVSKVVNRKSLLGGFYTDTAVTVAVGKISKQTQKLLDVTKESLDLAIQLIKPGVTINQIGGVIQNFVEKNGFSVVKELVGHGVGYEVHEEPQIPNFKSRISKKDDIVLRPGMVIAIEPMVNVGDWQIKMGKDGFAILTADGSLSAHFEHTMAITETGCEVLTEIK